MSRFKISRVDEDRWHYRYGNLYICHHIPYDSEPDFQISCTICKQPVGTTRYKVDYRYYEEDTGNPEYQALKFGDYIYTFCSAQCRSVFTLNPLAYEV